MNSVRIVRFRKANDDDYCYATWLSDAIYDVEGPKSVLCSIENLIDRLLPTCEYWYDDVKYGMRLVVAFKNPEDEAHFMVLVSGGLEV
jgi:hypothetical protein